VDTIANLLRSIKQKLASSDPNQFAGFILWTVQRDVAYMNQYFGKKSKFFKDIIQKNKKTATTVPENATFYEAKVHIPEITGCLPFPDMDLVYGAYKPSDQKMNDQARADWEKQRPQRLAAAFPEILKISLYPSFFHYSKGEGKPIPGHLCMVSFSEAMPSKGFGIYNNLVPEATQRDAASALYAPK
jgi:hypothetical protein